MLFDFFEVVCVLKIDNYVDIILLPTILTVLAFEVFITPCWIVIAGTWPTLRIRPYTLHFSGQD